MPFERRAGAECVAIFSGALNRINMSRARGRKGAMALMAIPEDEPTAEAVTQGLAAEIMQLIDGLEASGG